MTDREAMRLALDALENHTAIKHPQQMHYRDTAIEALRQALEQPEQEPVGEKWTPCVKLPVVVHVRNQREGETHVSTREGITPVKPDDLIMRGVAGEEYPIGRELFNRTYTFDITPPKREWVWLTDEELVELFGKYHDKPFSLILAIHNKIKEKNK